MKQIFLIIFINLFSSHLYSNQSIYSFELLDHNRKKLSLNTFGGKVILITNIATKCGYTHQLDDLEKLYSKYKTKGLMIIGIPSNDFGGQTPETNEGVAKFCRLKYGVEFPITEKMRVIGKEKGEIFKFLKTLNQNTDISWNFEKFLFDKNGNFVSHFTSSEKPLDGLLEKEISKLLD